MALTMKKRASRTRVGLSNGRVDFTMQENINCMTMADFGFSTAYIKQVTKLTPGQIGYRLRRQGQRLDAYRNGQTMAAKEILKTNNIIRVKSKIVQ